MIEKILDNYYSKKLIKLFKDIEMDWYLDFNHIYSQDNILILVKRKKYSNKNWKEIARFKKEDSLIHLCNRKELEEYIRKLIRRYCEKEK